MLTVRHGMRLALVCLIPLLGGAGCAALSPLNGVPVNYYPQELRGELRSGKRTIDLSLLRQTPPDAYRLDCGDVLSVFIDGVLGRRDQLPPIYFPRDTDGTPPSFGYPVAVRDDGTVRLPLGKPIDVRGMTIPEAEEAIRCMVQDEEQLLGEGNRTLLVSLQRPRLYNVLVIRQEQSSIATASGGPGQLQLGNIKRGMGKVVTLPAYKNDVLHALADTGGLPGLDAENTIYVVRRRPPALHGEYPPGRVAPGLPHPALPPEAANTKSTPPAKSSAVHGAEFRGQSPEAEIGWRHSAALTGEILPDTSSPYDRGVVHGDWNVPQLDLQGGHTFATGVEYAPSPLPLTVPPPGLSHSPPQFPPQAPTQGPYYDGPAAGLPPGPWPAFENGDIQNPDGFLAQRRMDSEIITIPIRLAPGEAPQFCEEDIILQDGDVVFIESRETEVFYTGGLLGGNQFNLPRDYDIDVVRAIAIASGINNSGGGTGFGARFGGVSALNRDISVGASDVIVMRQFPDGSQVPIRVDLYKALRDPQKHSIRILPGDYVVLQYKPHEAIAAFVERNLLAGGIIGLASVNGTGGGGN